MSKNKKIKKRKIKTGFSKCGGSLRPAHSEILEPSPNQPAATVIKPIKKDDHRRRLRIPLHDYNKWLRGRMPEGKTHFDEFDMLPSFASKANFLIKSFSPIGAPHSIIKPSMSYPVLFIPFEATYSARIIGTLEKKGAGSGILSTEAGKDTIKIGASSTEMNDDAHNQFGPNALGSTQTGPKKRLFTSVEDAVKINSDYILTRNCGLYDAIVADRLTQLAINHKCCGVANGLPVCIILSERVLEWPTELKVSDHVWNLKGTLGGLHVQDMALYVLNNFDIEANAWQLTRSVPSLKANEHWMKLQMLIKGEKDPICIGLVHLSSNLTKLSGERAERELDTVETFAGLNGIHAVLGDMNSSTLRRPGGAVTIDSFEMTPTGISRHSKILASSGSGTKMYMGAMIIDNRLEYRGGLAHDSLTCVPPYTLEGELFSDHTSLYARYAWDIFSQGGQSITSSSVSDASSSSSVAPNTSGAKDTSAPMQD